MLIKDSQCVVTKENFVRVPPMFPLLWLYEREIRTSITYNSNVPCQLPVWVLITAHTASHPRSSSATPAPAFNSCPLTHCLSRSWVQTGPLQHEHAIPTMGYRSNSHTPPNWWKTQEFPSSMSSWKMFQQMFWCFLDW